MGIETLNEDLELNIPMFDDDMDIIAKLDDEPNAVGGLTAAELKAEFDRPGKTIKKYLNETLVPSLIGTVAEESVRAQNEYIRVTNENQRIINEEVREAEESVRAQNEYIRATNENQRIINEEVREAEESVRAQNEYIRATNENQRVANENGRVEEEERRNTAELERIENEDSRGDNETKRVQAETARAAAEAQRESAEQAREDKTSGIVAQATEQANEAKNQADRAEEQAKKAGDEADRAAEQANLARQVKSMQAEATTLSAGSEATAKVEEENGDLVLRVGIPVGRDGKDGNTPYIGSNGNWWIGDTDTGVSAGGDSNDESGGGVSKASELENDVPFVSAVEQTLTEEQQTQARKNISAPGKAISGKGELFNGASDASGWHSHAEGIGTKARGDGAHAEGSHTDAIGLFSHSEGQYSAAKGRNSHAEGRGTVAACENQHVQGAYNIEDVDGKYIHIVGNGSQYIRSNAHTIDKDGNAWFAGDVFVGGDGQDHENAVKLVKSPATAHIGQVIAVKEVDENGRPTAFGVENVLESIGGDTLTWDGNTEGLEMWDGSAIGFGTFYKVSDATPTAEQISSGKGKVNIGEEVSGNALVATDMGDIVLGSDGYFILFAQDNLAVEGLEGVQFPKKGIYFAIVNGSYLEYLTIPGYTGFAKKRIKEEYIPESVPRVQTAAVGQTIVVSEVDKNGRPIAWEAADMGVADTWEVIYNGEITEDVKGIIVDKDSNGEPFSLKDYKLMIKTVAATESPTSSYSWFWHNNGPGEKGPFYTIYNAIGGKTLVFSGKLCENCWYCQYISDTGLAASQYVHMRNALCVDGAGGPPAVPVYKFTLTANTGNTCGAGSKVVLFGVRA